MVHESPVQYDQEIVDIFAKLPGAISGVQLAPNPAASSLLMNRFGNLFTEPFQNHVRTVISPRFQHAKPLITRLAHIVLLAAELLEKHGNPSLENSIRDFVENDVLISRPHSAQNAEIVTLVTFAIFGWLTLLWKADDASNGGLAVDASQAPHFLVSSLPPAYTKRTLCEIAYNLGDNLPVLAPEDHNQSLKVASLNFCTLKRVGRLQTKWVDSFCSHLELDPATNTLYLFRFPSQLALFHARESSLSRVLETYYDETRDPTGKFRLGKFIREVNLSYALLFRYDRTARKLYRSDERQKAAADGNRDPMLDELCLGAKWRLRLHAHPVKESFHAGSDFPILTSRLLYIQDYIDSIQPSGFTSLWRDRRDILRWYTFWAVIIVGGANLLVATLQSGIAIAQLVVAKQALVMQVNQACNGIAQDA